MGADRAVKSRTTADPFPFPRPGLCVLKIPGLEGLVQFLWEQPSASARLLCSILLLLLIPAQAEPWLSRH